MLEPANEVAVSREERALSNFELPGAITEYLKELDDFRRVVGYLFGFMKQQAPKGVATNRITL